MTDKEKIREELKRLQTNIAECLDDLAIARDRNDDGDEQIALRRMESLLVDTKQTCTSILNVMQEEPVSEELKEFEREYIEREKDNIVCVYDRHAGLVDGAKWQKEQLMKDATEAYIRRNRYTKQNVLNGFDVTCDAIQKFNGGDKVKVLILK